MTATDPLPGLRAGDNPSLKPPAPRAAQPPEVSGFGDKDAPTVDSGMTELEGTWHDLRERFPETVALMKVIPHKRPDGSECFQLEMHSHHDFQAAKDAAALDRQGRPKLVLADKLAGDVDLSVAEECYDELLDAAERPELTSWLTDLRRTVGDRLQLIIWDDTDFGIPWELFWHEMDESPAWLGTVAEITRWVTVRTPERRHHFSAEANAGSGHRILYFEDPALLPTMNHSILDRSNPDAYVDSKTMIGLLRELNNGGNNSRYGLVYIRCHGSHSHQRSQARIADVPLLKVSGMQLRALRESRALVFLNACNSARQVTDSGPGDNASRNFVEVFLRRHAGGVVATLAEVGATYSASLPRKIVARARNDGVRIPEFLREERAKEARGLPEDTLTATEDEKRKILSFLRVSMFAYFGHPNSVFKLVDP